MSGPANPFRAPVQSGKRVKCLVYGPSGVGKTYFALTAPGRVAVIDTEGGTSFYAERPGLSAFDVLPTKTFAQVEAAVAYLRANPAEYATLVIDPVTVIYQVLQDAAQQRRAEIRNNPDADMEQLDWQRVKRAYTRLMNDLVNLPLNVVVTAREADLTEERKGPNGRPERVKVGFKPEAEKSTTYHFDAVLRLVPAAKGREAVIEKDRTGANALGARIPNPSFADVFASVLNGSGQVERNVPSDEAASRIDAGTTMVNEEVRDREETATPHGHVTREGVVERGEGMRSDLRARQQPDGSHALGFLLNTGGSNRPQCVATGPIGTWLVDAMEGAPEDLAKARVTVSGDLFEVTQPGRRKFYRLVLDAISGDFGTYPPATSQPAQEPVEAVSEALAWEIGA